MERVFINIAFLLVLLFYFICSSAFCQHWIQKKYFGGTARYAAVGFSIGNKGYISTGSDGNLKWGLWEYDPVSESWTQKAQFSGKQRILAVGFSIEGKGYIGTGYDGTKFRNDFWEYDPAGNSWTQKANFPGTERATAVGFSIGSKGYVGTGIDEDSLRSDFWEYDPATDSWTSKANFSGKARRYAVGFSIGSKGYIGTGNDSSVTTTVRKDFWEYNPTADTWTQKQDFTGKARYVAVGFSIGSKGYIGTGWDGVLTGIYENDIWEYDPAADSWTQKENFGGTAREHSVGFSIDTVGYIATGWCGDSLKKDFWAYNPIQVDTISNPTDVNSHLLMSDINIYPNPGNGVFTIDYPKGKIKTIAVYNELGEKVNNPFTGLQSSVIINITFLPKEIYLLHIETDKGMMSRRVAIR